ncbi:hypothetical protein TWF730_008889 [Orbilia blumenaviensis]|uniref:Uncharacterized protein n=1 Tax=Orbilia blumenaviensis TaxID=1796055 RepID=A0AAV9V6S7_9PEZI
MLTRKAIADQAAELKKANQQVTKLQAIGVKDFVDLIERELWKWEVVREEDVESVMLLRKARASLMLINNDGYCTGRIRSYKNRIKKSRVSLLDLLEKTSENDLPERGNISLRFSIIADLSENRSDVFADTQWMEVNLEERKSVRQNGKIKEAFLQ